MVDERVKELPERNVLISVPCSLHSKKPPLAGSECVYVCVDLGMRAYVHAYVYVCVFCVWIYIYMCVCVCVWARVHAYCELCLCVLHCSDSVQQSNSFCKLECVKIHFLNYKKTLSLNF